MSKRQMEANESEEADKNQIKEKNEIKIKKKEVKEEWTKKS